VREAKRSAAGVGELIGYARCSTVLQDLTAQREILTGLGVAEDRIYLDKGLTGTNRARPGPGPRRRALATPLVFPRRPLTSGSACLLQVSSVLRPDPMPWHHRSRRKAGPDGRVLDHQRGR